MHISALEVSNYRNFQELTLSQLPPAVVVVGENAVGKTNLLAALRLVLDPALPDAARVLDAEDFWEGLAAPFEGAEVSVSVEVTGYAGDDAAEAVLADATVETEPLTARLTYVFRPKEGIEGTAAGPDDYEFVSYVGDRPELRFGADVRRFVSLNLLPALRDAEGDLRSWRRSPLAQLLKRLRIDADTLAQVGEATRTAASLLLQDDQVATLNTALNERVRGMVGEVFSVDLALGVAASRETEILRAVELLVGDARALGRLSLGTLNVLYLALLLELLVAQRREGEIVGTIIAAEEPEAHLHPHLQRVLFRHLLRREAPLLLTTHSAHIASVAPLRAIVVLRGTEDGTKGFTARLARLNEPEIADIERYLDVTRADLLFARGIILVEGIAELYVVPAVAAEMGHDLDSLGITVCSVHGVDFTPYRKLLQRRALDIPHVVVTDGDADADARDVVHAGVKRAAKLLHVVRRQPVKRAIESEDWAEARRLLAEQNIFVSEYTLEVDLAAVAPEEMCTAFADLVSSEQRQRNFRTAIESSREGDLDGRKKLLARITDVGKGRFAQRVADHAGGMTSPPHIAGAVAAIVDLTSE